MNNHVVVSRPRIATLDYARGIALLGILLMNISGFGLPKAAYLNPAYLGTPSVSDAWTWALLDLSAQAKFLAIFAILFGAGLELLRHRGTKWSSVRLAWLALFGVVHTIFLWDGDILLPYALTGLVCWHIIHNAKSTYVLLRNAFILYLIGIIALLVLGAAFYNHTASLWQPSVAELQYETFWKLQGGIEAWRHRFDQLTTDLLAIIAQYGWALAGLMLLGAALIRSGWLLGRYPTAHYLRLAVWLIPLSLLIQLSGVILQWHLNWDHRWSSIFLQVPRELGTPLHAVGYLALVYGFWPRLSGLRISHWVAQVGRMALSNYLLQTVICSLLFYHFGLYQQFDRLQLLALVPLIWLVNLFFSNLWLRYFTQGPAEWLWRELTTWVAGETRCNKTD